MPICATPPKNPMATDAPKYFGVMVIHLVFKSRSAFLAEPFESVEVDRIPIRHDEPMEGDGEPCLTECVDFAGFSYDLATCRNQEVLAVMGVNVVGEQAGDGAGKTAIEPVDE